MTEAKETKETKKVEEKKAHVKTDAELSQEFHIARASGWNKKTT